MLFDKIPTSGYWINCANDSELLFKSNPLLLKIVRFLKNSQIVSNLSKNSSAKLVCWDTLAQLCEMFYDIKLRQFEY